MAFVFAGLLGLLLEVSVIQWMYRRPLDSLLATVGVALVLQQLARDVFGAQGDPVAAPSWLGGRMSVFGYEWPHRQLFTIALAENGTLSLFDVGGDDVGARVLGSLRHGAEANGYELWQVVNTQRPFTQDASGCLAMRDAIEASSRMRVTGLVVNSHLMEETTPEVVLRGVEVAREVSRRSGLPIRFVAVMEALLPALRGLDGPVLAMERQMLPPWLLPAGEERLPAGRPVPLGKAHG
jgi:hypothetical protein